MSRFSLGVMESQRFLSVLYKIWGIKPGVMALRLEWCHNGTSLLRVERDGDRGGFMGVDAAPPGVAPLDVSSHVGTDRGLAALNDQADHEVFRVRPRDEKSWSRFPLLLCRALGESDRGVSKIVITLKKRCVTVEVTRVLTDDVIARLESLQELELRRVE